MLGKITYWNKEKGFGFIRTVDSKEDFFFHHSALVKDFTAEQGKEVTFDIEDLPATYKHRTQAVNVCVL